jgi:O-methyltransferase
MIKFLRNKHFLINLVVKIITKVHPVISHNIAKINFFKDSFFLLNLEQVEGDYIEFGVFDGTSLIAAYESNKASSKKDGLTMNNDGPKRKFFGFDSFEEGFKIFDKSDVHPSWINGNLTSSYEKTNKRISKNLKNDEFKLVKGFVEKTCKNIDPSKYGINKISLALFDMDLGTPTLIGLEFIKNSLVLGSIVTFDEYYAYKGSEKEGEFYAFKQFREDNKHLVFRKFKNWGIGSMSFILSEIKN